MRRCHNAILAPTCSCAFFLIVILRILTRGRLIVCKDRSRYADLLLRMLYEEADYMPYYRRILSDRRDAWIGT